MPSQVVIERPVRAVVFDLYGTLLTIHQPRRPYRRLLDLLNVRGSPSHPSDAATVMTTDAGLAGIVAALGVTLPMADLAELERDLFEELASVRAFDDALPTLQALRDRGLRLALCSNLASPYAVPAQLLLPAMDAYGFSFVVGAVKPRPEIYAAVCEGLQLPPSQVLMVGDTLEADVEGPEAFGMQACHLVRGGSQSAAARQITSLSDLLLLV